MKQYPTIPKKPKKGPTKFYVFDKLDGSNVRAKWSMKRGFHKFGTRKRLLGSDQGLLYLAQGLIEATDGKFRKVFSGAKIEQATCFFEFWGDKSFAGSHVADDVHRVTLFDVSISGRDYLSPKEFVGLFEQAPIETADLLYHGPIDELFRSQVVDGTLPGMTDEGVICKANPTKRFNQPNMFKIKSQDWIDRVKAKFDKSRWEDLL